MNYFLILTILTTFFIQGCGEQKQKTELPGDSEVLVTVNGSPISRFDLDLSVETLMGQKGAEKLDETGRKKMLESLVMSRAIAQVQEKTTPREDLAAIDRRAAAYREKLLVRRYLAKHAPPEPVSREMIRDYYEKHPEEFGAQEQRIYEIISSRRPLKTEERDALLRELQKPGARKDWKSWVADLGGQGYPLQYRRGGTAERILHPKLQKVMQSLNKRESSPLIFIKERCYLVRVIEEKKRPARPLQEVSGQIRKILAPAQLKKAVEQASREVLQKAEVEYR